MVYKASCAFFCESLDLNVQIARDRFDDSKQQWKSPMIRWLFESVSIGTFEQENAVRLPLRDGAFDRKANPYHPRKRRNVSVGCDREKIDAAMPDDGMVPPECLHRLINLLKHGAIVRSDQIPRCEVINPALSEFAVQFQIKGDDRMAERFNAVMHHPFEFVRVLQECEHMFGHGCHYYRSFGRSGWRTFQHDL